MSTSLPNKPSQSTIRRNPDLYAEKVRKFGEGYVKEFCGPPPTHAKAPTSHPVTLVKEKIPKPLLNALEKKWKAVLVGRGVTESDIMEQAITLRLDPPFKSYTADLALTLPLGKLVLFEVKGPHRFREKGIAKAALAAKTYPQLTVVLADWKNKQWKETTL